MQDQCERPSCLLSRLMFPLEGLFCLRGACLFVPLRINLTRPDPTRPGQTRTEPARPGVVASREANQFRAVDDTSRFYPVLCGGPLAWLSWRYQAGLLVYRDTGCRHRHRYRYRHRHSHGCACVMHVATQAEADGVKITDEDTIAVLIHGTQI